MISELKKLKILCNKSECNFILVLFKSFFYRLNGVRNLFTANRVYIKGLKNFIFDGNLLLIGLRNVGHVSKNTPSYFNVRGNFVCSGSLSMGRGCRVDVNENAVLNCGGGYIGPENTFIVYNGINIGKDCNISWGCQFLDDDFHLIKYENKREKSKVINIGNNVWIGCNVSILKGSHIASGCVVAANSVVSGDFIEENCLIAGNPAKVVKRNISWEL